MASEEPKEFLVVSVPNDVAAGTMLRLLASESTLAAATKTVGNLGSNVTGRVAVLERKAIFDRRPAIESVEIDAKLVSS